MRLIEKDVEIVMFDQYFNYTNSQIIKHSFDDGKGERRFTGGECRE